MLAQLLVYALTIAMIGLGLYVLKKVYELLISSGIASGLAFALSAIAGIVAVWAFIQYGIPIVANIFSF